MKNIVIILLALLGMSINAEAQQKKNKNARVDIEVKGNCEMCKKRIEKAAFSVKGVKSAEWHADDKTLHLILDERKNSPEAVQEAVAKVGHNTVYQGKEILATKENYENLHHCCQY